MMMKRGHRPKVWLCVACAAVVASAGCMHPGVRMAQEARERGDYIAAAEAARVAVEDNPNVPGYKALHEECRRKAADWLVQRAEECMQAGDLVGAEHNAARALAYAPENKAALALNSKVFGMKQQTLDQLADAERLIAEKKPDEAALLLEKLLPKAATYPQIKQAYRRALLAAYDLHVAAGVRAFEAADYAAACKEFEAALVRLPEREDGQVWLRKAQAFLRARQMCERAESAFAKGAYQEAHARFKQAQAEVPDYPDVQAGLEKALYHWTDEVYGQARELEGRATKPALCESLDLYQRCESLMPGFKDVSDRTRAVRRRLAEIYAGEGEYFLRQPDLQTIGLAHFCLQRAVEHDPANRRAKTLLPQARRLFDIYRRVTVRIDILGKGQYPSDLAETLARKLSTGGYPDLDVAVGRTGGAHSARDAEVRAIAAELGIRIDPLDVPYSILQIGGQVERDLAKKTGADKPLAVTSAYVSHEERVPNIEFEDVEVRIAHWKLAATAADREAAGLDIDLTAALEEYNRCSRRHAAATERLGQVKVAQERLWSSSREATVAAQAAESEQNRLATLAAAATQAANAFLAQAQELDRKAAAAQTDEQKAFYRRQAEAARTSAAQKQREAQNHAAAAANEREKAKAARTAADKFATQARAVEPEVLQLDREEQDARARLAAADQHLKVAQAAVADCKGRRQAARFTLTTLANRLNVLPRTIAEGITTSYSFSQYQLQTFGCVAVNLYILAEHGGRVLARPSANVSKRLSKEVNKGVHEADINGYENTADTLPSAAQMREELERAATARIVEQVDEFFSTYHQERFYNAARQFEREKQDIPAANAYACFLACRPSGSMAAEARSFLERISRKQLR